jgi:hypothetical protein
MTYLGTSLRFFSLHLDINEIVFVKFICPLKSDSGHFFFILSYLIDEDVMIDDNISQSPCNIELAHFISNIVILNRCCLGEYHKKRN